MRCCASSTTSTAADPVTLSRDPVTLSRDPVTLSRDPVTLSRDPVTLSLSKGAQALLFREILKPLAQGLGPLGEIALGAVADDLFMRKPR